MTLSGRADARLLLSIVGSGKLLARSRESDFFTACKVCELRRRRMIKMEMMSRSIVTTDVESS